MTETTRKETYFYDVHGSALGGQITGPFQAFIDVQAGASLPTIGGYGSSRAADFRFREIISFRSAHTEVMGAYDREDGGYHSLATSVVEGLNILGVVTADRVVARASSAWKPGEEESRIVSLGSQFENLRIGGGPVDVELNADVLVKLRTFASLKNEFKLNAAFRTIAENPLQTGQLQNPSDATRVFLCSLVKDIKGIPPGVERRGNMLHVREFGRIFLAEVVAEPGRRALTMLRLELGCALTVSASAASVVGGGSTWP